MEALTETAEDYEIEENKIKVKTQKMSKETKISP